MRKNRIYINYMLKSNEKCNINVTERALKRLEIKVAVCYNMGDYITEEII